MSCRVMHCRVNTCITCIHNIFDNDEGSISKIISDIQMVPHACRFAFRALHTYELCELCESWFGEIGDLTNYVIGE